MVFLMLHILNEKFAQLFIFQIFILGFLIQTVFLMIAAYVMDPIITIISISLFVGFASFSWCGFT